MDERLQKAKEFGIEMLEEGRRLVGERVDEARQARHEQSRAIEKVIGGKPASPDLLLAPADLNTADPSFAAEWRKGQFGLDGMYVELDYRDQPLFEAPCQDADFQRALHGFDWLRDLAAGMDAEADREAAALVCDWITRHRTVLGIPYEPRVAARRVISWLTNAPAITIDMDTMQRGAFLQGLAEQVAALRRLLDEGAAGLDRLTGLAALGYAGLCLSDHRALLQTVAPQLEAELDRQILPDGGHISRNPDAILGILFDLLPLQQCFKGRKMPSPAGLDSAIARMLPMTRFFRMGDSSLARFNGQRGTPTDALATLLGYDSDQATPTHLAEPSGYARLQDGPSILMCDIGASPPADHGRRAHAGCLSFELSVRHFALVVNAGGYRGDDERWRSYARSTAAHSTLSVDQRSQGGFEADGSLNGPHEVLVKEAEPLLLEARHYGYQRTFGYAHNRRLQLSHDGLRLSGVDSLAGEGSGQPVPFEIRFHLHPFVELAQSDEENLLLTLPDGEIWRFHAANIGLEVDDGIYLGYRRGLEPIHTITLFGQAPQDRDAHWLFEQYRPRPAF